MIHILTNIADINNIIVVADNTTDIGQRLMIHMILLDHIVVGNRKSTDLILNFIKVDKQVLDGIEIGYGRDFLVIGLLLRSRIV